MWHMHPCAMASESFVAVMFLLMIFCRVARHYFVEHLHSRGANAPKLAALKAPSPIALFLRSEPMTQNKNHHPESQAQSTDAQASVEEQELQGLLEIQSAHSVASIQSAANMSCKNTVNHHTDVAGNSDHKPACRCLMNLIDCRPNVVQQWNRCHR
ncbi:hypothetical protein MUK42_29658 [Musa troglodytarum]|uniref:Uncharacterized protein n=1 Tax=Musa troglodytarum TaxID=320322 RepID=A0A9E7FGS5_9LILI|nr:hypothetical protein MUK42_29658 [Musa troglodytarum]